MIPHNFVLVFERVSSLDLKGKPRGPVFRCSRCGSPGRSPSEGGRVLRNDPLFYPLGPIWMDVLEDCDEELVQNVMGT